MYEAARVDDPIYHTSALAGFLIGAIIGIAIITVAAFAFFTCGFFAGLVLGFLADQIASGVLQLGESPYGPGRTKPDNVCVGRIPAFAGDNVAGKADVPVRCGTAVHAGGSHHGARRESKNLVLPYGPDGHGTGGDRAGRDAGVGRLPGGIW